ncbi:apoptotic protease-activating factor 1-like protein, partial [Lasius niger]
LNTLYHNVKNLEIQADSFTPLEKDSLIRFFKYYFDQQDNRNALLILDDVSDKNIINAFDFQCKTLVLTADIDVLQGKVFKKIEMNDGFTETETLGLFAKVLDMDVNKLPIEAKRIHEECKGMPLLIAMFAAQFEEFKCDMRIQPNRWRYYLQSLRKKDAKNKVIREFFEKQETIFDMCIQQLKPDLKKHYKSLAIFNEDVNITQKTLAILWEEDIYHVDELMLDLCQKSLAAKKWNEDLKMYIYGVHDLLLCHLKRKLSKDELTQMHKSVIEKYREHCNNDFSKLPDDNYIYSYIGYHLEKATLFEEFPKLYLDFDFIQAKIMHSGLRDLLLDLNKYRKHIIYLNNEAHVSDIETFLQEQASIILEQRRKKCLDIIQIAMNHPYQDYVTQTAKQLAMRKGNYLYLSHTKTVEHVNVSLIHEISTDICTSSFTDDSNLILIGNTSGKIILWNCESMQQKVFNGHDEEYSIKKLILSTNGDCFLSLSSAGIIKLFALRLSDALETSDHSHIHMESPRQKQSSWTNMFTNNNLDDSVVEFSIKNEMILDMAFGYDDQYIAACTNKTIQMWNRKGELVFTTTEGSKL